MLLDKFLGFSLLIICILFLLDLVFMPCSFYEMKQSNIIVNGIKSDPINQVSGSKHQIIMGILFMYSMYYIFNNDKNNYKIFGDWDFGKK